MARDTDVSVQDMGIKEINLTKTVRMDDNGTFYVNPNAHGDFGLSKGDLAYMISQHRNKLVKKYDDLFDYFRGKHKTILKKPVKDGYNPDNRIIINYPKQIVKSYVGYFAGVNPSFAVNNKSGLPKADYERYNKELDDFNRNNDINHFFVKQAKYTDIFGRSLALVYQNELGLTKLSTLDPRKGFVVYSDDVSEHPVFGVMYKHIDAAGMINVDVYGFDVQYSIGQEFGHVDNGGATATKINYHAYNVSGNADYSLDEMIQFEQDKIGYGQLPLIEFTADDERMSLYEDLLTVFDAIDSAISEKKNDVDYFGDAVMFLRNMLVDKETFKNLRDKRMLIGSNNGSGGMNETEPKAGFLEKPTADQTQENLINRLVSAVYDISGVVNLNDKEFTNAASGQALKQRLQGMRQNADTKASMFDKSFRDVYSCLFNGLLMPDAIENIIIRFKKNEPIDVLDESSALVNLSNAVQSGMISQETALGNMTYIEDALDEIEKIKNERKDQIDTIEDVSVNKPTDNKDK